MITLCKGMILDSNTQDSPAYGRQKRKGHEDRHPVNLAPFEETDSTINLFEFRIRSRGIRAIECEFDVLTACTAADVHDQHDVQVFTVFLHRAAVAPASCTLEVVVVQPDAVALVGFTPGGVVLSDAVDPGRFEEARKERWRFVEHCILRTGKRKRSKQTFGDEELV